VRAELFQETCLSVFSRLALASIDKTYNAPTDVQLRYNFSFACRLQHIASNYLVCSYDMILRTGLNFHMGVLRDWVWEALPSIRESLTFLGITNVHRSFSHCRDDGDECSGMCRLKVCAQKVHYWYMSVTVNDNFF
jgi:hypothetical protein